MAFVVETAIDRDSCRAEFPLGTARKLAAYWTAGSLKLFLPEDVPSEAFVDSSRKTVTDIMSINSNLGFCPEARKVVEELEPGLHQFFPVKICRKRGAQPFHRIDGRILDTPYYLLNPGVRIDAVFIEKSDVKISTFPHVTYIWHKPNQWSRIVLHRSAIAGRHIWKGGNQLGLHTFFSDKLVSIYRERKWRGLTFTPIAEE